MWNLKLSGFLMFPLPPPSQATLLSLNTQTGVCFSVLRKSLDVESYSSDMAACACVWAVEVELQYVGESENPTSLCSVPVSRSCEFHSYSII